MASTLSIHPNESHYVKHVVGLPGDHAVCCDSGGLRTVSDVAVEESPLHLGDQPGHLTPDATVAAERMWVMADHCSDSAGSPAHLGDPGGGMVPFKDMIGRAGRISFSPGRVGIPAPASHVPQSLSGAPATAAGVRHS